MSNDPLGIPPFPYSLAHFQSTHPSTAHLRPSSPPCTHTPKKIQRFSKDSTYTVFFNSCFFQILQLSLSLNFITQPPLSASVFSLPLRLSFLHSSSSMLYPQQLLICSLVKLKQQTLLYVSHYSTAYISKTIVNWEEM